MAQVEKKVYCFWTGRNAIPPQRGACLDTMYKNIGVPVEMIDWRVLPRYVLPEAPLHEGFRYLSCNHKSDYLRCYFCHFYGGGYSDIKWYVPQNNWKLCFDIINHFPQIEVIGQAERIGGSPIKDFNLPDNLPKMLANCYFICRPRSEFTQAWYNRLQGRMDVFLPMLRDNPATEPFGGPNYRVPWASLMGEIFHETIMEFRSKKPEAVCSALMTGCDMTKRWR